MSAANVTRNKAKTSLTCKLGLFFVINPLLINLLLIAASTPWRETVLFETFIFFHRAANLMLQRPVDHGTDSWNPMIEAHAATQVEGEKRLYDQVFFEQQTKFQYPPSALLVVHAARHLPVNLPLFFDWVSWFSISGICVIVGRLLLQGADEQKRRVALVGIGSCFALTFHPLMKGLALGQIQSWINLLVALLLILWMKNNRVAPGILAGLITLVKPHYLVLLAWAVLRKQWRFAFPFLLTASSGIGVSIWLFGFENHLNYFDVLSLLSQRGESYYANQSANGVLNRLMETGTITTFDKHAFPAFHPVVVYGTIVTGIVLLVGALLIPGSGSVMDLSIVLLSATLASPVAWDHHYGILLPIYALLAVRYAEHPSRLFLLGISYFLTSNYFAFASRFTRSPDNLIFSYLLAGALSALAFLYSVEGIRWRNRWASHSRNERINSHAV